MGEKTFDSVTRYVIRRVDNGDYYNGKDTFYHNSFDIFSKAKVFNNICGAKVACLHLSERGIRYINECPRLEIVEVHVSTTNNIITYDRFFKNEQKHDEKC